MLERLRAMMTDRNGLDKLSISLIILALVINAFSQFFPLMILFSLIIMIFAIWRVFSKNLVKRRKENYRFTRILGDIKDSFAKWQFHRQQSKQYKFFNCPGCKSKLRVPRGKGKISITCPRCGLKFSKKS
jgi:uncharacterized paraquat-inducible protein A